MNLGDVIQCFRTVSTVWPYLAVLALCVGFLMGIYMAGTKP